MPRRITTEANGIVINVESIPERIPTREQNSTTRRKSPTSTVQKKTSKRKVVSQYKTVECPFCHVMIKEASSHKHLLKECSKSSHKRTRTRNTKSNKERSLLPSPLEPSFLAPGQIKSGRTFVRCSKCQVNLRESNWQKHLAKVHAKSEKSPTCKGSSLKQRNIPTEYSRNKEVIPGTLPPSSKDADLVAKGLIEETRFGDKYVGQYNREADGRFGSISLYDDYSEESYPD